MSIMPQTLNKLRAKLDRGLVAAPFSSLPEYKSITYHQGLGKMLGIANPFFRSTEGSQGRHTLMRRSSSSRWTAIGAARVRWPYAPTPPR